MPASLHALPLFRSDLVRVVEVVCRPSGRECGREECSTTLDLVVPRSGVFRVHRGSESAVADPNQVLFFRPDAPYRVSHPLDGGDVCTVFTFAPAVLAEALSHRSSPEDGLQPSALRLSFPVADPGSALLHRGLLRLLTGPAPEMLAIEELTLRLLAGVAQALGAPAGGMADGRRPATRRAHEDTVERTKILLAARFREPLSLAEVARAAHTSPFHLARLFRRYTGLPIHRYLRKLRLRASLEALGSNQTDLTSLALDLGFAGHSHFTDAFRSEFRLSPSEFRRGLSLRRLREMSRIPEA